MINELNELIEKIGGRERLEAIVYAVGAEPCDADPILDSVTHGDIGNMARALLAVMDAKPVGTVSIAMEWPAHRNIATVNMRPDLVMSEMRDGDNLYTTPPAARAPEGWKLVPIEPTAEMLSAAREWGYTKYGRPVGNEAVKGLWIALTTAAPEAGGGGGGYE